MLLYTSAFCYMYFSSDLILFSFFLHKQSKRRYINENKGQSGCVVVYMCSLLFFVILHFTFLYVYVCVFCFVVVWGFFWGLLIYIYKQERERERERERETHTHTHTHTQTHTKSKKANQKYLSCYYFPGVSLNIHSFIIIIYICLFLFWLLFFSFLFVLFFALFCFCFYCINVSFHSFIVHFDEYACRL